jgi:hypothetical protein
MFDIPSKLKALQEALVLSDKEMADYLGVDVTGFREAKGGTQELSAHGVAIVLDSLGFVELTDAVMMLLTKKARAKLVAARTRQALSIAQKKSLAALKEKIRKESKR